MKIRSGFVSNSSSSSFVCLGWEYNLNTDDDEKFMKDFCSYLNSIGFQYDNDDIECLYEFLDIYSSYNEFEIFSYYDDVIIGKQIIEDVTFEELKNMMNAFDSLCSDEKSVYYLLKKYLGEPRFISRLNNVD